MAKKNEETEVEEEVVEELPQEEPVDYTIWHPDHRLNHIYMAEDGRKIIWTMKSGAEKPTLKVVD